MTDWFGGIFEGRVGAVYDHLANNGGDFAAFAELTQGVVDSLSEPVANLTLTHGNCGLKWHGRSFFGGSGFFMNQDVTDLRTVTMSNDNLIVAAEFGNNFADFHSDGFLSFSGGFTVSLECVSAKSYNNSFLHNNIISKNLCLK